MNVVKKIAATVVLALGLAAGSAHAVPIDVMTFDTAAFETYFPYVEGAQRITGNFTLGIYCETVYPPGKAALTMGTPDTVTLTRVDGNPFDFISWDFDELNAGIGSRVQTFVGHKVGGGTVTEAFTTDGVWGALETFVPTGDFTGLTSLEVNIRFCRFDNITSQIPEPATLSLLALGACLQLLRRRR